MGSALIWIGVTLQVIGVTATGFGAARTWRDFGPEPFWEFVTGPSRRAWRRFTTAVRKLGRRKEPVVTELRAAGTVVTAGSARLRVGFREIPQGQDVTKSIGVLDDRTRRLMERIERMEERHADDVENLRTGHDQLLQGVERQVEALQDSDREVATGGIRLEALGLFLIAVGVVLQGLALI